MNRKISILIVALSVFMITFDVHAEGWKEKKGYKYYEDAEGNILTGFQEIDGETYFLSRDTTRLGAMRTGMLTIGDQIYYLNPYLIKGPFSYGGKEYFANSEGEIQVGFQTVNGKIYFYSRSKAMYGAKKTGMITVGDANYYLNPDAKTGWFTYKGNEYYANSEGAIQVGFQTIDNKIYFLSRDRTKYGAKKTGMLTVGGTNYYLNPDAKTGWFTYKGNEYYANNEGAIQVGFQTIDGKIYFLSRDKTKYGAKKTGLLTIGDKIYYLNPYIQTGWFTVNGKKYYANTGGDIARGFTTINGDIYFFSNAKGQEGVMRTGWIEYCGDYYYLGEDGKAYKDVQEVNGRSYKFNTTNGKVEGFKVVNGKKYYYNPDGTLAKGVQYMMDKFWKFDEIDGAFKKYVREIRVADISTHNGNIDWNKVKASGKVDAVILRLGYGIGFIDTKFLTNKAELERLGIPYSVYLFSYGENKDEALRESNFLVDTVKENKVKIASNIFSIYYDLEDWVIKSTGESSDSISQNTYKDMITTFINNTEKKLCIKTRVYSDKNHIETRFPSSVRNYATWVAQWGPALTYTGPYEGWQYTNCASIPGINGCVDMSKFYY